MCLITHVLSRAILLLEAPVQVRFSLPLTGEKVRI